MKFENTEVWGFDGALRGMRNPKNSWDRSDSYLDVSVNWGSSDSYTINEDYIIGPNDLDLAKRLINAGTEHRKFLRMIHVQVDITAPMYVWSEYDTYKVATVANSTSKMHKIKDTPITIDCFETDDYNRHAAVMCDDDQEVGSVPNMPESFINYLERLRQEYLYTEDKRYWKELIRWLPESWLQTRTVDLNYETLRNIYHQRKNHKLTEWHTFCSWIESLPYAKEFIIGEN